MKSSWKRYWWKPKSQHVHRAQLSKREGRAEAESSWAPSAGLPIILPWRQCSQLLLFPFTSCPRSQVLCTRPQKLESTRRVRGELKQNQAELLLLVCLSSYRDASVSFSVPVVSFFFSLLLPVRIVKYYARDHRNFKVLGERERGYDLISKTPERVMVYAIYYVWRHLMWFFD